MYDKEEAKQRVLLARSKALEARVGARKTELDHAHQRQSELLMLRELAAFVESNYAASAALQPKQEPPRPFSWLPPLARCRHQSRKLVRRMTDRSPGWRR